MIELMIESAFDTVAQLIRIGSLAKLTGVPVTHLRRLANAGLIRSCRVGPGYHRRFPKTEAIRQVREILHLHS